MLPPSNIKSSIEMPTLCLPGCPRLILYNAVANVCNNPPRQDGGPIRPNVAVLKLDIRKERGVPRPQSQPVEGNIKYKLCADIIKNPTLSHTFPMDPCDVFSSRYKRRGFS